MVEEYAPLQHIIETFGKPKSERVAVTIEENLPFPRIWFLDSTKSELIQIQADRFIHNWRKVTGEERYPHYEAISESFLAEVEILQSYLTENDLGTLKIDQCEVTYVNHIEPLGVWQTHGELEKVFRNWVPQHMKFLPGPEDAGAHVRYVIHDRGEAIGRLHATLQAGWKKTDGSPVV